MAASEVASEDTRRSDFPRRPRPWRSGTVQIRNLASCAMVWWGLEYLEGHWNQVFVKAYGGNI